MIIDCHTHYHAHEIQGAVFSQMYGINLVNIAPSHGDEELHLKLMEERGYDMQFLSQPPFTQAHDLPARLGIAQAKAYNESIAQCVEAHPTKFRGVASLPLQDIPAAVREMERAVRDLKMIGVMINPDPSRRGTSATADEEYWYPIYETACALEVPIFIHPGSCAAPRLDRYNLALHLGFLQFETEFILTFIFGRIFDRYPDLKVLVSHGGGAIPYQCGRFQAATEPSLRSGRPASPVTGTFVDNLRKMYFDTCLYSQEGLECLIKVVGVDHCLFGTEVPGLGTCRRPDGRFYDNVEDYLNAITWLSEADRQKIYAENVTRLFNLKL
jgi:OH-DDVA meta-cleavage compound hydrolase